MNKTISPSLSRLCQKIWNHVREQFCVKYPFFHRILWNFSFQVSSETASVGTDGTVIYYNPDFLIRIFQKEPETLENLLLHMLYHCMFLHLLLEAPSDTALWNLRSEERR